MVSTGNARRATDEQLMLRVARGSSSAFGELVDRYHGKVLSLLHLMLGERERARDLTQECFLRLLRSARRYRVKARFSTYLFTIARRLAYDETRRPQRAAEPVPDDLVSPETNPEAGMQRGEEQGRVRRLVAALPAEEREVLLLSELAGLRYAEIARAVGCPAGTVASRKNRALSRLRRQWQGVEV
jgi:RNA polymerase sigma-70 factor (ECF subfamily)